MLKELDKFFEGASDYIRKTPFDKPMVERMEVVYPWDWASLVLLSKVLSDNSWWADDHAEDPEASLLRRIAQRLDSWRDEGQIANGTAGSILDRQALVDVVKSWGAW
jgi:hypothetical protein